MHPVSDSAGLAVLLHDADWSASALTLTDPSHEALAARAIELGAVVCHPFANVQVLSGRADETIVRYVNRVKGRPVDAVGSALTTRAYLPSLFDWSAVPAILEPTAIVEVIEALLARGPFGFRGPAAHDVPTFMSAQVGLSRSIQVLSPGYACPSNNLIASALDHVRGRLLVAAPCSLTGGARRSGAAGTRFLRMAHADVASVQARYARYEQTTPSVLSFDTLVRSDDGRPALVLEHEGSLAFEDVQAIVGAYGFAVEARERAPRPRRAYAKPWWRKLAPLFEDEATTPRLSGYPYGPALG
jgi:hypothetical protein